VKEKKRKERKNELVSNIERKRKVKEIYTER
jgi:hypothetical protein